MKRYKHKKTGYVALQENTKHCYMLPKLGQILPPEIIENSNDWEEIIENKPLFVTVDGVEGIEGDEYCFVTKFFNHYPFKAQLDRGYVGNKEFSTKEAAQQYIDLHKPKYSLKDVEEAGYFLHVLDRGLIINKLKNLNK